MTTSQGSAAHEGPAPVAAVVVGTVALVVDGTGSAAVVLAAVVTGEVEVTAPEVVVVSRVLEVVAGGIHVSANPCRAVTSGERKATPWLRACSAKRPA
jgi:hypothetical protein